MPFSKPAIFILSFQFLLGQSVQLDLGYGGRHLIQDGEVISSVMDSLVSAEMDYGYVYRLRTLTLGDPVKVNYELESVGFQVDSLVFKDKNEVASTVKGRLFHSLSETGSNRELERELDIIRGQYPFVNRGTSLFYGRYGERNLAAVLHFKPEFENHFTGIIGSNPDPAGAGQWQITGQMDFHLENLWRTAGTLDLYWRRTDASSQIVRAGVEEPFLVGLPFGVQGEFEQELWEGLYTNLRMGGAAIIPVGGTGIWHLGLMKTRTQPTATGLATGMDQTVSLTGRIRNRHDQRNSRWLRTQGYYWDIILEMGRQTRLGRQETLKHWEGIAGGMVPTGFIGSLHGRIWTQGTLLDSQPLQLAQKVRYGGTTTLRGYAEDLFASQWVVIPTVEWVMTLDSERQWFIFYDQAIQSEYQPMLSSYGLGFSQLLKGSYLEIVYGVGRSNSLTSGKLHIKLSGRL